MATSYPAALDSYTTKADGVDTVQAAHVNNLQDAIVAIETELGVDPIQIGTWTPVIKIGATTITGTVILARYTKINRLVYIELDVQFNRGANSGAITLTGLPFTPAGSTFMLVVLNGQSYAATAQGIKFTCTSGVLQWLGGTSAAWDDTQITSGTREIWINGAYSV